jgi:dGTPase
MHDLEDGLTARMFTEEQLETDVRLWCGAREAVELRHPGFLHKTADRNLRIKRVANELIKICINDLIESSARRLQHQRPASSRAVRERPLGNGRFVGHSQTLRGEIGELQKFLHERFYRHERLQELTKHAASILETLFAAYLERPQEMPTWYRAWAAEVGLHRAVCDYIAGMTDRFAQSEHLRLVT